MDYMDDDPGFSWIGFLAIVAWIVCVVWLGRTLPLRVSKHVWLVVNVLAGLYAWNISTHSGLAVMNVLSVQLMSYGFGRLILWELRTES